MHLAERLVPPESGVTWSEWMVTMNLVAFHPLVLLVSTWKHGQGVYATVGGGAVGPYGRRVEGLLEEMY